LLTPPHWQTASPYSVRSSMLPGGLPADDSEPYIPAIRGMAIERPAMDTRSAT